MTTTVPCRWCGTPTEMTGTQECHKHWELRHRIESEPAMARRILDTLSGAAPQGGGDQAPP